MFKPSFSPASSHAFWRRVVNNWNSLLVSLHNMANTDALAKFVHSLGPNIYCLILCSSISLKYCFEPAHTDFHPYVFLFCYRACTMCLRSNKYRYKLPSTGLYEAFMVRHAFWASALRINYNRRRDPTSGGLLLTVSNRRRTGFYIARCYHLNHPLLLTSNGKFSFFKGQLLRKCRTINASDCSMLFRELRSLKKSSPS